MSHRIYPIKFTSIILMIQFGFYVRFDIDSTVSMLIYIMLLIIFIMKIMVLTTYRTPG